MKTLSILRHGKSSWENSSLNDVDRPLLSKGINRTKSIGKFLQNNKYFPDCIITSPATRAMQTASIVFEELKLSLKPQICKKFYPGKIQDILDEISNIDQNITHVMIVGHNPVFTDLVSYLSEDTNIEWLPTSGLVMLNFNMSNWKSILSTKGKCIHYIKPKEL